MACFCASALQYGGTEDISPVDDFSTFLAATRRHRLPRVVEEQHRGRLEGLAKELLGAAKQLLSVGGQPYKLPGDVRRKWEQREVELATLTTSLVDLAAKHDSSWAVCYADALTLLQSKAYYGRLLHEVAGKQLRLLLATANLDHMKLIKDSYSHSHADFALMLAARAIQQELRAWNSSHETAGDGHCVAFRFGGDEFAFAFVFPSAAEQDVRGNDTAEGTEAEAMNCAADLLKKVQMRVNKELQNTFDFRGLDTEIRRAGSGGGLDASGPAISIGASVPVDCNGATAASDEPVAGLHQLYVRAVKVLERGRRNLPRAGGCVLSLGDADVEAIQGHVAQVTHGSPKQQEIAAAGLASLATSSENRSLIAQAGALEPLIALLEHGTKVVKENAAAAISNLSNNADNQVRIVSAGGIQPLVGLLSHSTVKAKESATSALQRLAVNVENKVRIAEAGALLPLVQLLAEGSDVSKENAAATLLNLGGSAPNRLLIVEAGALQPLVGLLETGTERARAYAVGALKNLSLDAENKVAIARAGALKPLVGLLGSGSGALKEKAAAALANLAVNEENRLRIVEAGGLEPLLSLLEHGSPSAKEKAAGALFNLSLNSDNRELMVEAGAMPLLEEVCQSGSTEDTRRSSKDALEMIKSDTGGV